MNLQLRLGQPRRFLISQHSIRIVSDYPGYVYAFLMTHFGQVLVRTNRYGAVIQEIEPEHLHEVLIPNPPKELKQRIHDLVIRSYSLRDESNALLDRAERLLLDTLKLPPIEEIKPRYFNSDSDLRNFTVEISALNGRLDASYHLPIVDAILGRLCKEASELTTIGDARISRFVILPGRFARVYVDEGQGTVFLGGKQISELDPANKKYLSLARHGDRIQRELRLEENMILITRSGTIGMLALVPKHWEGWVASEHIIRVIPASLDIAGYLFVFLATDYGRVLITRYSFGSVVDEIDVNNVVSIPVPLLKSKSIQADINCLALEANAKLSDAYRLEIEAIKTVNEQVIHCSV